MNGGQRYIIQAFDACTWSIIDQQTQEVYALSLTLTDSLSESMMNFTISLSRLVVNDWSKRYLMFDREILSAPVEVSEPSIAYDLIQSIINHLLEGEDIANPVNLAILLGADLHGQPLDWTNYGFDA